ncbi:mCG145469, partial [Mus musculus]
VYQARGFPETLCKPPCCERRGLCLEGFRLHSTVSDGQRWLCALSHYVKKTQPFSYLPQFHSCDLLKTKSGHATLCLTSSGSRPSSRVILSTVMPFPHFSLRTATTVNLIQAKIISKEETSIEKTLPTRLACGAISWLKTDVGGPIPQ